jgi:hypothetical protein
MIHREYSIQEAMNVAMRSLVIERELTMRLEQIRKQELDLLAKLQAQKEARLAMELSD